MSILSYSPHSTMALYSTSLHSKISLIILYLCLYYLYLYLYVFTVLYIFNMYDSDNEGVIDVVTCKMVIRQLYGDTSIQDVSPGAERSVSVSIIF